MSNQPAFIVIEGVDRTGKTTLQHKLNKYFNYKYVVIDRSHLSHIVYNRIYKRGIDERHYKYIEDRFKEIGTYLIYLFAEPETLQYRLDEEDKTQTIDVRKHLMVFKRYYNRCTLPKISINTSINGIEEVFEIAKKFIEENEKQQFNTCRTTNEDSFW